MNGLRDLEAREDLAESLVPVAERLIGAVHTGGPAEVGDVLYGVAADDLPALCVVLAAAANPDQTMRRLLAWVDQPVPMFNLVVNAHPRTWTDGKCHDLWKLFRSDKYSGLPRVEKLVCDEGYREWERRRKDTARHPHPPGL